MERPHGLASYFRFAENVETVAAGTAVFREGDAGACMYVVRSGEVDILVSGDVVETVTAGGVLGELALVDEGPRSATAIARTNAELVPVDSRRFEFLVQQHPFFALEVMRVMAQRLRAMDARVSRG